MRIHEIMEDDDLYVDGPDEDGYGSNSWNQDKYYIVVKNQYGKCIGHMKGTVAYLDAIETFRRYRHRRKGYGKQLMTDWINRVKTEFGATEVRVETDPYVYNPFNLIDFYKSAGFVVTNQDALDNEDEEEAQLVLKL